MILFTDFKNLPFHFNKLPKSKFDKILNFILQIDEKQNNNYTK